MDSSNSLEPTGVDLDELLGLQAALSREGRMGSLAAMSMGCDLHELLGLVLACDLHRDRW